jgi:ketosteroid isomerase-like protein
MTSVSQPADARPTKPLMRAMRDAVEDYYAHIDAQDLASVIHLFADDAVYCRPGYEPLVGTTSIEAFYRHTRVIQGGEHQIEVLVQEGRDVAVRGVFRGRLRNGTEVDVRFADFWCFNRECRVARRDTYFFAPAV